MASKAVEYAKVIAKRDKSSETLRGLICQSLKLLSQQNVGSTMAISVGEGCLQLQRKVQR